MKRVNLVLCRHCQTNDNAFKIYTGQNDVRLNDNGLMQAAGLRLALQGLPIKCVVSSDLRRAEQTASRIGGTYRLDPRLREVNIGKMAGLAKAKAREIFWGERFDLEDPFFDFTLIGGETRAQVRDRYLAAAGDIAEEFGSEEPEFAHVAVVGHGSAFRVFMEHLGLKYDLKQGSFRVITYPMI